MIEAGKVTRKLATWTPVVLMLSLPSVAFAQAEPPAPDFGSVWVWSDPSTFEQAIAIEINSSDGESAELLKKVYFESPKDHRAELTSRYNPETAGYGMIFRDSVSGWKAEVEGGFIFEDETILPIPQARWNELIPVFHDPEVEGIAFLRVSLSNGIEVRAQHPTSGSLDPDLNEISLLRESLAAWMDELSPDELQRDWDFPESTLEMLQFLAIPQAEPLRVRVGLVDALIETTLYAHRELEERRAALYEDSSRREDTELRLNYQQRDWRVTEGTLEGAAADRAGARTMVEMIEKELASHE